MASRKNLSDRPQSSQANSRPATPINIGARIKEERIAARLTLDELARRAEFSEATLSRIENNKTEVGAHKLFRLAAALGIDVGALFSEATTNIETVRHAVTRDGDGPKFATGRYEARILGADVGNKLMHPFLNDVSVGTLEEAGGCRGHDGQEFLYIVSGAIDLHLEGEDPLKLTEGDSFYFNSSIPHAYVNAAPSPSQILVVTSTGRAGQDPGLDDLR